MYGPNESVTPENYLDVMFGAGGLLAQGKADYRPRDGQIRYARAVDRAISEGHHLLAEGPVGVGKSFGYSVPASFWASTLGKTIVIVTANIALQEQIIGKDLPLIQSIAPWEFSFALLKGRNNYLCLNALRDHEIDVMTKRFSPDRLDNTGKRHLSVLQSWGEDARRSSSESMGDKSELPFEPAPELWRRFSVTSDECLGDACEFAGDCFANRALEIARRANVIVTNYHLLFAHLKVYADSGLDLILPPFDVAVLDEAHKAADIGRDFFGIKPITEEVIRRSIQRVKKTTREAVSWMQAHGPTYKRALEELERCEIDAHHEGDVASAAGSVFRMFEGIKRDFKRYKGHLSGDYGTHEERAGAALLESLYRISTLAEKTKVAINTSHADSVDSVLPRELMIRSIKVGKAVDRMQEMIGDLRGALHPKDAPKQVYYLDENEKKIVAVRSRLVYASDALRPWLFEKHKASRDTETNEIDRSPIRTPVIATSATLAIRGNDFSWVAKELGCDRYETVQVPSPFHWREQALFITPRTVCSPKEAGTAYHDSVAAHIEQIVLLAGGRTLCLFTSNKSLNTTYARIAGPCQRQGIRVLKQGDAPRTQLIEMFKKDIRSVLLGVESFWAGVDVPGEACSVVVIDRLPFPTPDDPVLSVISEHDSKWFFKYSVPRAIIQVQQGAGRLIRSISDRGVLVILDPRVVSQKDGYGGDFKRSLPNMLHVYDLNEIPGWLKPPAWDEL